MYSASWLALAFSLTALGGIYTWWAWSRRGLAAGLRGLALTLLAPAAWMTGLLEVVGKTADAFANWAAGLVFRPLVWLGLIVFAVSFVLFGVAGMVAGRQAKKPGAVRASTPTKAVGPGQDRRRGKAAPAIDDDMAEIEAILKSRGIT
jgi:hypothetical protein